MKLRKTPEEKAAEDLVKAEARAFDQAAQDAEIAARDAEAKKLAAHVATVPKWDYHVETIDLSSHWTTRRQEEALEAMRSRINLLGAEGWEMISYESIPMYGSISKNLDGHAYLAFFRRPAMPSEI